MSNSIADDRLGAVSLQRRGTIGLPLLNILAAFPIALFSAVVMTDLSYVRTANMMWADFSAWMLAVGEAFGALAALIGFFVLIAHRHTQWTRPVWPVVAGGISVLVIGLFNNLVHSRDAWTSVVPTGLALSVLNVVLMLVIAWYAAGVSALRTGPLPSSGVR